MKQIIKGKLYNTVTARQVGYYSNNRPNNDFSHVDEYLYLKKTGEYFIYGVGGQDSKYAVSQGQNSWSGGERIVPMTVQNVKEWAEKHLSAEEYEAEFGEINEDEGYTFHSVKLTNATSERLRRASRESGRKIFEIIEEALSKALQ